MTTSARTSWLTFAQACLHVQRGEDHVRLLMDLTDEAKVERCWINSGTASRINYQFFDVDSINRWYREVSEWRATASSREGGNATKSGGATPTARPAATPASPRQARSSSSRKSKPAKTATSVTSLSSFRASLPSGRQ